MARTTDYVVIGAGSAGCALAARLSEDPAATVTLIEAGGPDSMQEIHIPAAIGALFKTRVDWDFDTDPEAELLGRRLYLPRGRVLGGSSSINAMIYMRGNPADFDGWAAGGATGWGYDDVLPYFKRSEDNERGENEYHGVGGPLAVSDSRSNHDLVDRFVQAGESLGHAQNADFNGITQDGIGRFQFTQRNGMRCSTAVAFLHPALARPNLEVLTGARALRLIFEGTRAVGVEIEHHDNVEEVRAVVEVIVCAGAYQSPQLLMLSGIGPAAELAPLQIPVLADLPVGKGLQDHIMAVPSWFTSQSTLGSAFTPENVELLQRGTGPLTSNAAEGGGFFRTRDGLDGPDVQLHALPLMFHQECLAPPVHDVFSVFCGLLQPTSRGEVTLRSPVPSAQPRIVHNFLSTPEDRDTLIAAVRLCLQIARTAPLAEVLGDCFVAPADDSDATIEAFVRAHAQTVFHPTSTCAIGTVVDSELRVYGVEGLRVADASVMPRVPRANTNAATIMVAEKAADLIKGAASARTATVTA
ncbi:MAG: putative choline dehydrogenase [Conexibacter sp.]|nr:putative choline dehydrogenase [Conexibacter sp.]